MRQACGQYHLNFRTIHKIVRQPEPMPFHAPPLQPKPVLGPFLAILQQIIEADRHAPPKQRHTARRICERLRDEHGYPGFSSIVRDAVRACKWSQAEAFVPLLHPPGEGQVTFEPLHYLALLERKPGALDYAQPLAGWSLPDVFAALRRRLEEGHPKGGTRQSIRVLRTASTPASFAVNGKKWINVFPTDGLFDSKAETFKFKTAGLKPGTYVVVLRVRDAAGNTGSVDVVFNVQPRAVPK